MTAVAPDGAGPGRVGLAVWWGGRWLEVPPGAPFVIGRDEDVDLRIDHHEVSRRHLVLVPVAHGWELEDRSSNGSYVGGQRIGRVPFTGTVTVALGSPQSPNSVVIGAAEAAPQPSAAPIWGAAPPSGPGRAQPPAAGWGPPGPAPRFAGAQGRLSAVHDLRAHRLRIGRAPDNDVVIDDLLSSRYHAELHRDGPGWRLVDLGSANGTYLNGQRIANAPVGPQDVVGIGHSLLYLSGDRLVEHLDTGEISFRAHELVVRTPSGKQLLDRVGFSLEQRSLLAVVGPSGAGKSTLLRALTGFRPADEGQVQYAGRDLYADYDELRQRIGLVPQDDILHKELTVRRALGFAARLRFPSDVARSERKRRIEEVIAELGLTEQRDQRISSLSGGQRKRTSVALELLTRPSLLFLDEPTSGLDPGLDKSVMQTLRGLADDGRTVVVVTHSVAHLEICDRLLLMAPGGALAFFGPPSEALSYFGQADFADLFLLLERDRSTDWGARFRHSPQFARYIGGPGGRPPAGPGGYPVPAAGGYPAPAPGGYPVPAPGGYPGAPPRPPRQQSALTQFRILCGRYLAVIGADLQYTMFMAGLPLVLTLLMHALPGKCGLSFAALAQGQHGSPNSLLLVMVVGGALMGSNASIRELVKEREIYRRERAIGLSRAAYLGSKVVVLGAITGLQAVVLGFLGNVRLPGPDAAVVITGSPMLEIVVGLTGLTFASMALGLMVSAAINNEDRGMPLLVFMAMLQFMLSSALIQIGHSPVLGQLSWLVPARWGFALGASTIGTLSGPGTRSIYAEHDPLWSHTPSTWFADLGAVLGLAVLFIVVTALLLRRLDPRRRG